MKLRTALAFHALALSSVSQAPALADSPATCPIDGRLADLIADSDLVVVGKMQITKDRLAAEGAKASPDYLDIPVRVESVIKGESVTSVTMRFYPRDASYKPSNDAVISLADKPAILFLTRVDEGPVGLYFAGATPDALRSATVSALAAARSEVSRQAKILTSWRRDISPPHLAEVTTLIARLGRVSGDEQQRVFDQLVTLGEPAVPAIIARMDDRRVLRTRSISLVNRAPDAFEAKRLYAPKLVVDGLDAVLNQITGAGSGSIVNGGSNRQRDAAVAGWRIYAIDSACGRTE